MDQDGAPPPLLQSMDHDDAEDVYSPPPTSATSTSSSGGSSQDEGWTEQEEEEEALLLPKTTTSTRTTTSRSISPTGLACRVLRLELPTEGDLNSFLGVEKEELIVTCQLLRGDMCGDEATNVASTRLPTSYRPSKGQICWDQKLDLINVAVGAAPGGGMAYSSSSSSSWRATSPDAALHFMLWSSSTLLGQGKFLLSGAADNTAGSMQRLVLHFTRGAKASTKVVGRRESCGTSILAQQQQHQSPASLRNNDASRSPETTSLKRAQASSLWRRTVSEPTPVGRDGFISSSQSTFSADVSPLPSSTSPSMPPPSSSSSFSSYAWPQQATLVFELLYPSSSFSSSSSTTTITTAPASNPTSESTVWQRLQLILARPSDGVSVEEARSLWLHRHSIIPPSSRALVKLLRALMVLPELRQEILLEQQQQQQQMDNIHDDGKNAVATTTTLSCPVLDVLHLWREGQGGLPILDAMKLLSGHFSHPSIRALALETLKESTDEELGFFLLQLVQLLRYESTTTATTTTTTTGDAPPTLATAAALQASRRTSTDTDKTSLSSSPLLPASSSSSSLPMNMTPLAHLLIQRACRSPTLHLANSLFWYLATEMQHSQFQSSSNRGFEAMRFAFLYTLREANESAYSSLCAQEVWVKKIAKIQQRVFETSGLRERKQVLLRSLLSEKGVSEAPFPVPLPIDPSMLVTRLDAETACVYGSTTYPAFITFLSSKETEAAVMVEPLSSSSLQAIPQEATEEEKEEEEGGETQQQQQQQQQQQHAPAEAQREAEEVERRTNLPPTLTPNIPSSSLSSLSLSSSTPPRLFHDLATTTTSSSSSSQIGSSSSSSSDNVEKVLIFKCREDLRQDQLVLQLISLMDTLLKKDLGLDLYLTPYRVLATGPRDGMIEFVSTSSPISEVLTKHGSIQEYFRAHSPEPGAPFGVCPDVLATFIKSLAGYCVITYLLGIGDRHLHNIMLCPDGRFFHLDFGFILGKDPKPTPLLGPFRLSASMVEGMGGKEHENFGRFKHLCVKAFNGLRRHAEEVVGVVGLMVDAGLKDLGGGGGAGGGAGGSCSGAGAGGGGGGGAGGGGGGVGGGGGSIGGSVGGSSGGGVMMMMGSSLNLSSSTKSTTTSSTAAIAAVAATAAAAPPPHHLEAARILSKMEGRFRLDLTDEEAGGVFEGLIHKALGALAPQVIEMLHNLAVKTK